MADHLLVDYILPLGNDGRVQLRISTEIRPTSQPDQEFLLAVMDKVTEFVRVACPAAPAPEVPAVLRGLTGTRP